MSTNPPQQGATDLRPENWTTFGLSWAAESPPLAGADNGEGLELFRRAEGVYSEAGQRRGRLQISAAKPGSARRPMSTGKSTTDSLQPAPSTRHGPRRLNRTSARITGDGAEVCRGCLRGRRGRAASANSRTSWPYILWGEQARAFRPIPRIGGRAYCEGRSRPFRHAYSCCSAAVG
jgi:hypothetical protein